MEAAPMSVREGGAEDAADPKSFSVAISDGTSETLSSAGHSSADCPRFVVHSLKLGLAIVLASVFYWFWPLRDGFIMNVLWGILTAAIVFEPTFGATLVRGLNRILATISAGALGIGAHRVARLSGRTTEPILLGFFVFLIAVLATFARFFPRIKTRSYDHRVMLFNMTFCLTTLSGHPDGRVITVVLNSTSTIILGCCVAISVFALVFPSWSGKELHDLILADMDTLGKSLQGLGIDRLDLVQEHKTALTSEYAIETLVYFARWEPGHSEFRLGHPWKKYMILGSLIRQCAHNTEALRKFCNSKIMISADAQHRVEELCKVMSVECGNSLREMASALRKMTLPHALVNQHLAATRAISDELRSILRAAAAKVPPHLFDIMECVEQISQAVNELTSLSPSQDSIAPDYDPARTEMPSPTVIGTYHLL